MTQTPILQSSRSEAGTNEVEKAYCEGSLPEDNDTQNEHLPLLQEVLLLSILSLTQFCTQVGVGGPLAILHIIGNDLHVSSPGQLSWLMAAYSLTVGTFILPSGRLGDLFGHKLILIVGMCWFAVWSFIAGLAVYARQSYTLFVFARALQGIGPALCLPNALAILGRTYKNGGRKNMIFSCFGATAPVGSVVGAVSASLWANYVWWPWAFWSFAVVLASTAAMAWYIVPPCPKSEGRQGSLKSQLIRLDPVGNLIGVCALIFFNFAWNQAPISGWSSPAVLSTLILSVMMLPIFFYVENHVTEYPIIPTQSLNKDIGIILLCVGLGWSCFGIFLYYTWQFFEVLRRANPLLASAWYSTNGVSGVVAALLTGVCLERIGAPLAMVFAMLAYVVGTIFIATAPVRQTYWAQSFLCLLIVPFGMDISFPAATVVVSDALPRKHQGLGASLVNTVVNYSISLGLGIAGTVDGHVSGSGKTSEDLLRGFRGAWYAGIGLSSLGLAISTAFWLTSRRRLPEASY